MSAPRNNPILIDCNVLVAWSADTTPADTRARLEHLLAQASAAGQRIIIPTPVLAEFLVKTDEATAGWLSALERKAAVYVAPFDRMAAFECALIDRAALGAGDKRDGRLDAWQKIKIDRQIVAIGKALGVGLVVAEDAGVRSTALRLGMQVRTLNELDLPPTGVQANLPL